MENRVQGSGFRGQEEWWRELMLMPEDYDDAALFHPLTRQLMERIDFRHGGPDYDSKYPDGIPTLVEIEHRTLGKLSSDLVMHPTGHARADDEWLTHLLEHKFRQLASLGVKDSDALLKRLSNLASKSPDEIRQLYGFEIDHVRPA